MGIIPLKAIVPVPETAPRTKLNQKRLLVLWLHAAERVGVQTRVLICRYFTEGNVKIIVRVIQLSSKIYREDRVRLCQENGSSL